jgi:asparagine synthase (glutamine-hydrolysing)
MSGIYGVFRHDGAPADPEWMQRMRSAMAFYGPDGGGCKMEGPVGMGHLLLKMNPEECGERQPVEIRRGMVVSAARLDNREELLTAFDLCGDEAARHSDGDLVGLAFDRWGEEVSAHLEGDWAMAAWDRHERKLLLARDACGNAPLYYHEGRGFVAFASSLKALLALPGVETQPDMLRLAQVLTAWQNDAELTAYKGFRRLVWAHGLTITANGTRSLRRHWSPERREPLMFGRDEEYVEAFREKYGRAVKSCIGTHKAVGALLSGGRDSGSVVAMAAPLLAEEGRGLAAYTSVPSMAPDGAGDARLGDEWDLARATAEMAGGNVRNIAVDAAGYGVIQGIEHFLDVHDGPSHAASNHYWLHAVTEAAVHDGAGVVLTGAMGNATVSWAGNGSAALALRQGRTDVALQMLLHGEANAWLTLKRQILKPVLQPVRRRLRSLRWAQPWRAYSALNPKMGKTLDLEGRMRAEGYDPSGTFSAIEDMRLRFFLPAWGIGHGVWAELGARHGISFRDPTANQSLVEFLLRVPDCQFRRDGQSSFLMQRAFRDRLPRDVLDGQRKGLQAADVGHRIVREQQGMKACLDLLESVPGAAEILDLPLMRSCLDDLTVRVNPVTTARASQILLRGLGVGLFLSRMA